MKSFWILGFHKKMRSFVVKTKSKIGKKCGEKILEVSRH